MFIMHSIMYITALILTCIFQTVKTDDCRISHQTEEGAWEKKLMDYLQSLPTTVPNETVDIHMQVILDYFSISGDEETIEASSTIIISWKDDRLTWTPDKYHGISELVYDSYLFWEPEIHLMNEVDYDEYQYHYGLCRLYRAGLIFCAPKIAHEAPCLTKISNWPYDIQNCTLRIGVFTPSAVINVTDTPDLSFIDKSEYSAGWTIVNVYREHKLVDNHRSSCGKGVQTDFTFLLQREGAGLGAIVVYPAIALAVLTLYNFLFDSQDYMRLGMICFNMLCHFLFITEISDLIPKHSADTPTILFYLRESLLINFFLVMLTIFLYSLSKKTKPTPPWINIFNDKVLTSKIRIFIWPRSKIELSKKISVDQHLILSQWTDFSDILNSFGLWLLILVYFYLICRYIPCKPFVEPGHLQSVTLISEV